VRFTASKLFGAKTQTLTREENLISPPGFLLIHTSAARDGDSYNAVFLVHFVLFVRANLS